MPSRAFLDTNILLYSISFDAREAAKQAVAARLLTERDCVLSTQVLHEFLHQACRASRAVRLTTEEAWNFVGIWRRFAVQENTLAVLERARDVQTWTGYSIWDSLIVAAAQAQGCDVLYTEDMQDGRVIDRLRIVNPFRE